MISITNDLSANTFVVSATIGAGVWVLKKTASFVATMIVDSIKALIEKLNQAIAKVAELEVRLKELETKFDNQK